MSMPEKNSPSSADEGTRQEPLNMRDGETSEDRLQQHPRFRTQDVQVGGHAKQDSLFDLLAAGERLRRQEAEENHVQLPQRSRVRVSRARLLSVIGRAMELFDDEDHQEGNAP